ncbi:DUF6344 domain-containing protein [Streptomyces sp. NPDC002187]|uniref:DUF6344 domain-containing protein n=1 Tax=Streptomyces sp. NPDC002187 TaxID=3364637 RepID=UPI0036982053
MAAFKVRNLWTAFITAFFALLASVGLTTAATATAQPADRTPDEPVKARPQAVRGTVPAQRRRPSTRWVPSPRERSLPPTIKQRIGAEAHGASPAGRQLPVIEADAMDSFEPAEAAPAAAPATAPAAAAGSAAASAPAAPIAPAAQPARRVTAGPTASARRTASAARASYTIAA